MDSKGNLRDEILAKYLVTHGAMERKQEFIRFLNSLTDEPEDNSEPQTRALNKLHEQLTSHSQEDEPCPKCKIPMERERITYTDGVGDAWGWTCYGCGRTKETPLTVEDGLKFCYWRHIKEEDGWFTSCDRAYLFLAGPSWHNCPHCGNFIVIDYYGEYVKAPPQEE